MVIGAQCVGRDRREARAPTVHDADDDQMTVDDAVARERADERGAVAAFGDPVAIFAPHQSDDGVARGAEGMRAQRLPGGGDDHGERGGFDEPG